MLGAAGVDGAMSAEIYRGVEGHRKCSIRGGNEGTLTTILFVSFFSGAKNKIV